MGHRLLVVDSDRRFLQDHQASLEATFDAEFREGTEGALARLEAGDFSAVLVCVEASENKGYSLCSAIRRSPALADLRVALISAKATEEEYARHQSLKGRADLYLHKPIRPNALISALSPIMPMKSADPDNPLGDLGDEWLENLKNELEVETVPQGPPAPVPLSLQATQQLPVLAPEDGRLALETRIADLEARLAAQSEQLDQSRRQERAAQGLLEGKSRLAVELDALLNAANEQLEEDARELGRLRHQGQAAMEQAEEQNRLILELETRLAAAGEELDQSSQALKRLQLGEADPGRAAEWMDSNQALQAQLAEQREELERLTRSEQELVTRNLNLEAERNESLGAREMLEGSLAELHRQLSLLEETHERRQVELLAAIDAREVRIQVRSDRLLALSERLEELEQQARNTLELAKAEIN